MSTLADVARSATAPASFNPATLGRWQIGPLVHAGRRSHVALATPAGCDAALDFDYVIKFTSPLASGDEADFARDCLAREVEVARYVADPHLVAVLDADLSADPAWIVMPCCGERTLADRTENEPPLLPAICWQIRQISSALKSLHAAGWLHGDVCADNAASEENGHVTLLDTGFSRRLGTAECDVASSSFLGRPRYAAPELFASDGHLTSAADLYSLGVLFFELMTQHDPFVACEGEELVAAKRLCAASDVREFCPGVPYSIAALIARLLSREPLRRPTAADVAEQCLAVEIASFAQWRERVDQAC